jgi:hypothetical protein
VPTTAPTGAAWYRDAEPDPDRHGEQRVRERTDHAAQDERDGQARRP